MAAASAVRSCSIWLWTAETRLSWVIWSTGTTHGDGRGDRSEDDTHDETQGVPLDPLAEACGTRPEPAAGLAPSGASG